MLRFEHRTVRQFYKTYFVAQRNHQKEKLLFRHALAMYIVTKQMQDTVKITVKKPYFSSGNVKSRGYQLN